MSDLRVPEPREYRNALGESRWQPVLPSDRALWWDSTSSDAMLLAWAYADLGYGPKLYRSRKRAMSAARRQMHQEWRRENVLDFREAKSDD